MVLTTWILQVSAHMPVNQPMSDRWPQYIDWLNYLQWVDLRIFISPEWLFTRGKQRCTKAALWINPASRNSPQTCYDLRILTSGEEEHGSWPWSWSWTCSFGVTLEKWTIDKWYRYDISQLSGPVSPLTSSQRCLCSTRYTLSKGKPRFSGN